MPPRGHLSIRPKNDPHAISYSPQRDLAYMYPHAMREAIAGLDQVHWQDYFRGWLVAEGLTEADLGSAVVKLCDAHQLFIGDPTIEQPADALERAGFFAVPHPARIMVFERLGEVMMGGFFVALREVTPLGNVPNNAVDLAMMVAAGRIINERLTGVSKPEPDELHEQAKAAEVLLGELSRVRDNLQRRTASQDVEIERLNRELRKLRERPLWKMLSEWWKDWRTPVSKERAALER